jgi:deoxyribodipyrimidine photo-lyase
MMLLETFPPTRQAALARVSAVRPGDYSRSRNAIDGAVTGLSPYITHGLLSLPEVLAGVTAKHSLDVQHEFVFELGWYARRPARRRPDFFRRSTGTAIPSASGGRGPRTALRRPLTCWPPDKHQPGEPTWTEI